ncbi:MAG TPA: mercuric reductase [Bryobacteraceae bacterium]|jgi:pyruvate/2-oxoglutarate dehydrogenase complex dihydrolipoamide dehydrogenase (E3) component
MSLPSQLATANEPADLALFERVHPTGWTNPKPAALYDLVVIGGGPAGILTARAAAATGAKVALAEQDLLGGVCLNVGCVSSKALIRASRLYAEMRDAWRYGVRPPGDVEVDFPQVMERMRRIRARLSRRSSAHALTTLGIDVFFARATFEGRKSMAVDGQTLCFKRACIATGARPFIPSIQGLANVDYLTNETVFDLTCCPRRLLIVGGGPLGCELAQAFCRLGAQVTIAQDEPLFLSQEERDAAQILSEALARDGVNIHLNTQTTDIKAAGPEKVVTLVSGADTTTVTADEILIGTGRVPNVESLNLEAAGVRYDLERGIRVNDFLQTTNSRIYALGDACMEHKFVHIEGASARIVTHNALFGNHERLSAVTIPWCTYTDPEIAHVGMYVRQARENNIPVRTFTVLMHDVDRAVIDGEEEGFVKIHVKEGTDEILGATVVASHAGEMINDISLAITSGMGLAALTRVSHPYPTQAMAIKMAADACANSFSTRRFKGWLPWQ